MPSRLVVLLVRASGLRCFGSARSLSLRVVTGASDTVFPDIGCVFVQHRGTGSRRRCACEPQWES